MEENGVVIPTSPERYGRFGVDNGYPAIDGLCEKESFRQWLFFLFGLLFLTQRLG